MFDPQVDPGAASGAGESLLLRNLHPSDWKTARLQQKHAALPGISQLCLENTNVTIFHSRLTSTSSQSSFLLLVSAGFSRSIYNLAACKLFSGEIFSFSYKNLFHTNIFSFSYQKLFSHKYIFISSDACLARHFSFGIHWKDLHTVAGFALPLVDIYNV